MKNVIKHELIMNAYKVWGNDTEGLKNSLKCIEIEFDNLSENEAIEKYYQVIGFKKFEIWYHTKYEKIWCEQCIQTTIIYAKTKQQAKDFFNSDYHNKLKETIIKVYLKA